MPVLLNPEFRNGGIGIESQHVDRWWNNFRDWFSPFHGRVERFRFALWGRERFWMVGYDFWWYFNDFCDFCINL